MIVGFVPPPPPPPSSSFPTAPFSSFFGFHTCSSRKPPASCVKSNVVSPAACSRAGPPPAAPAASTNLSLIAVPRLSTSTFRTFRGAFRRYREYSSQQTSSSELNSSSDFSSSGHFPTISSRSSSERTCAEVSTNATRSPRLRVLYASVRAQTCSSKSATSLRPVSSTRLRAESASATCACNFSISCCCSAMVASLACTAACSRAFSSRKDAMRSSRRFCSWSQNSAFSASSLLTSRSFSIWKPAASFSRSPTWFANCQHLSTASSNPCRCRSTRARHSSRSTFHDSWTASSFCFSFWSRFTYFATWGPYFTHCSPSSAHSAVIFLSQRF
mmetsp:Transcript_6203/g.15390  ORF Transcript_6203/g.15390 Transcript_6203/m.15390 type:complete len:330 (-) Transcript_6203:107-1096(-)